MKIEKLFEELSKVIESVENKERFEYSGIRNDYERLDYGFFPIGSGILSEENDKNLIQNAEIMEGGIMILGNDFGIYTYWQNDCKNKREDNSPTIRNLQKRLGFKEKQERTFYTNFYLGLRDNIKYPKTTMTKRCVSIKREYQLLCYNFFLKQLDLIKPRLVICLGHQVRLALTESTKCFPHWERKSITMKELYEDDKSFKGSFNEGEFKDINFILIPHPCYNSNLKKDYVKKILQAIN